METTKKQTAVDWLVEQLIPKAFATYDTTTCNAIVKAKAMEKEQIVEAYWAGVNGSINDYSEAKEVGSIMIDIKFGGGAEHYYKETYEQ